MKLVYVFILILLSCKTVYSDITVAGNQTVSEVNLDHHDLVNIFTRKKVHWADGHKITVFIKDSESIEHKMFIMDVLNLTPYKYKTLVDTVVYSGENTPAIELSNDADMMRRLYNTPYSIGYFNYTIVINDSTGIIKIKYD